MTDFPSIYSYFPSNSRDEISKTFLSDLGRPTKRGIKKCPKCGIYNGTRGITCKNKHCDAVFKDYADYNKKKSSLDAVKLCGIVREVYSVRVRDRGLDHRGFVQLPRIPLGQKTENALCFVDSCQRLFDDSILKCHEVEIGDTSSSSPLLCCVHVDSAIKSKNMAVPVAFKNDTLNTLNAPKEIKNKLLLLLREKEGPLVQRVSRTVMAVKCEVSPKHPLGYLHFTFGCIKGREIYDKYYCSCTEPMRSTYRSSTRFKCIHYYACICALASDPKCSQEFSHFINNEFINTPTNLNKAPESSPPPSSAVPISSKVTSTGNKTKIADRISKRCVSKKYRSLAPNVFPVEIKVLNHNEDVLKNNNDGDTSWKFLDWLTYVTESINMTMQFENYGILNTLIFCIPENFYQEFKSRIPIQYKQDITLPHTHRVMNILHLKEIFDTPNAKLKISKRFVNDNGYLEEYDENHDQACQSNFIFFLNVGQSTVDESDNVNNPFLIEWIPNTTNLTKVGQLKLQYKYGRKST